MERGDGSIVAVAREVWHGVCPVAAIPHRLLWNVRRESIDTESAQIHSWLLSQDTLWGSIAFVGITIAVVWLINLVVHKILQRIVQRPGNADAVWKRSIFGALDRPFRWAMWIIGATLVVNFLLVGRDLPLIARAFPLLRDLAVILVMAWFLMGIVRRVEHDMLAAGHDPERLADPMAIDAVGKLARVAIVVLAILMAMPVLGFSISAILAFGGVGGIAVGFAAQGLVANLFGGLTVYASRPFKVGEWITIPGTEVAGQVQSIGWRATRVLGADRLPFYVPNSLFNTAVLINNSRMTARRVLENVHLHYRHAARIPDIVAAVNDMLRNHPGIERGSAFFKLDTYGDFAAKFLLRAYTTDADYNGYMDIKEDLLLQVAAIFRNCGAEIAVPATIVKVPDGLRLLQSDEPAGPGEEAPGQHPDGQ